MVTDRACVVRPAWCSAWNRLSGWPFLLALLVRSIMAYPVISEFMAANQTALLDEDGEAVDWIELHNPTLESVNLAGWVLSDQADLSRTWQFPERILEAGRFLVVFASGKNRVGPGPLHTNFRLEADGEYLGLFPPGQTTAVSEFSPRFPPQEADRSYGIPAASSSRDLLLGMPVWILVPTSPAELLQDWRAGAKVEAGWTQTAGFGLGYDETPAGAAPDENLALKAVAEQSTTGFGLAAVNAIDGDPATFTHTDSNDTASTWSVNLGAPAEIRRIILRNRSDCCSSRFRDLTVNLLAADGRTILWSSGLMNPENSLGSPASLTLDLFELNVGAIEAQVVQVVRTPDPDLSGSNGIGNEDEDNVLSLGEVEVYGVGSISFAPLIRTDLTDRMKGRNSSLVVRVPFVLDRLETIESLALRLRFADGVAVYLNGQEIASVNAPATPAWNSSALLPRVKAVAVEPHMVDLRAFRSLWQPGTNWLAFQGMSASTDDPDFLLDAQLLATAGGPASGAFLDHPTPGASNNVAWYLGRVADTKFSVNRGLYTAPFELALATATPDAEIRYTLDGSLPGPLQGLVYSGPIRIEHTTVVRAAAFKPEYRPTDVDTHTYVFPTDVATQPVRPSGFPATWATVTADYAMDARIAQATPYASRMTESLLSLPSLAITAANDDLFGASRGIYANPERNGVAWERPVSFEWIQPDGTDSFQLDCGLRIQGGYFRQRNVTQKHSLRLLFKGSYGSGRLHHDLFGQFGAAQEFDTLVLRAGANDGYAWSDARDTEQFIRDEFGRRSLLAMGQPSARGRFVHLYLNGLYWGLYNLTERPAEDFSATYLGGAAEDWDAINSGEVKAGSLAAWNDFLGKARAVTTLANYQQLKGLNPDGSPNSAFPVYFDAENYMDYMLLNIWGGNWDWPNKNFWFGRRRDGTAGGFKFYVWDFENTMGNNRARSPLNMVAPRSGVSDSWVAAPHDRLKSFGEYQLEFADRVQRHFFSVGALAPESSISRYRALAAQVESAIIAETARWGDDNLSTPQDLTDWQRERDWILGTYLPQRTGIVLSQLRNAGLFPSISAPLISPQGGSVSRNTPVVLSTFGRELFYTTNGLDPRLPGGAVRPEAIRVTFEDNSGPAPDPVLIRSGESWRFLADGTDPGPGWKVLDFSDAAWGAGISPLGYGDGDEATVVGFVDVNPTTAGVQKNATTYFRKTFNVVTPSAYAGVQLSLTYDDAAAVYLNDTEILRTDNLPVDTRFNGYAASASADNAVATRNDLQASLLRPGQNVVAVEVHQSDAGSSDISFDLALTGVIAGTAMAHAAGPLFFSGPTEVKARARQGTEWSALNVARFSLDTVPASSSNLVIAEFCYRPAEPAMASERAITTDRDDFEFIECMNPTTQSVELTGVRMTAGVLFDFPAGLVLDAGQRILVVRNRAAFTARYGNEPVVAGEYEGNLSNDGEELVVEDAAGHVIARFHYLEGPPWPSGAHQDGYSLVLHRPSVFPDHKDPTQWRTSVRTGGTPGGTDTLPFLGSPVADANINGQADVFDYAFGALLTDPASGFAVHLEPFETSGVVKERLVISLPRRLAADGAVLVLETADDVAGPWRPAEFSLVREERLAEGLVRQSFRIDSNVVSEAVFVRVAVSLTP